MRSYQPQRQRALSGKAPGWNARTSRGPHCRQYVSERCLVSLSAGGRINHIGAGNSRLVIIDCVFLRVGRVLEHCRRARTRWL
jgi:hypothetical protein